MFFIPEAKIYFVFLLHNLHTPFVGLSVVIWIPFFLIFVCLFVFDTMHMYATCDSVKNIPLFTCFVIRMVYNVCFNEVTPLAKKAWDGHAYIFSLYWCVST